MSTTYDFVCEDDLDHREVIAGLADGELERWRIDASGRQWFRRVRAILAVPPDSIFGSPVECNDIEGDDDD